MTWTLLTQVVSSLASLGAVAGASFAINHYRRAVRTRRAEWLASLGQLRQISDNEILALFEYDLRMLARHPFIIET